jgi:hypothetical protein
MKKLFIISIFTLILKSCLVNKYEKRIKGNYTLDEVEYVTLNDSSMIKGVVYDIHLGKPVNQGSIYIKGTKIGTFINSSGYFEIKIPAGEYVFVATSTGCTDMLTDEISLKKNEKKSITFFLGTHIMYEK